MDKELILKTRKDYNIKMLFCGHQKCKPLHYFGEGIHSSYVIHCVINGKGKFVTNGKTYDLKKGDIFLITPNNVVFYQADEENPWEYVWISIEGENVDKYLCNCGLSKKNPVINFERIDKVLECVEKMLKYNESSFYQEMKLQSLLYDFLAILSENLPQKQIDDSKTNYYIEKAIDYINYNYHYDITINDMAKYLSINRCYLSHIFKKYLNISPSKYLVEFRMSKAEELLRNTDLTIKAISNSCGYQDVISFSKTFKKLRKISPSKYRNEKF